MSVRVVLREQAERDVADAVDYYRDKASERTALDFVDDLAQAYTLIGDHPGAGSPRLAYELYMPGLRFVSLRRFPYLVFYLARENEVDVWRILHARRDIPSWLRDP